MYTPKILEARPLDNYKIWLKFTDLSAFYGILIRMYYDDHNPPHFHAEYGNDEA